MSDLINPQPRLLSSESAPDSPPPLPSASQDALRDELFSLVRRIHDPEHPHTLEELGVVDKAHIWFRRTSTQRQQRRQEGQDSNGCQTLNAQHNGSENRAAGIDAVSSVDGEAEDEGEDEAVIELTPTVPHCSLATTIGLCVRHAVESAIPNIKLAVRILDGTHRTAADSQTHRTQHNTAQSDRPQRRCTVSALTPRRR